MSSPPTSRPVTFASPVTGTYQAFPDMCRLANGDLLVVFYAGYHHISFPTPAYPRGGRICSVRSNDNGQTWTSPVVIYDDSHDNRDPHIAQLPDGSLACSFFSILPAQVDANGWPTEPVQVLGPQITRSHDGGLTWEAEVGVLSINSAGWACSAPVRVLPDGALGLGVYSHGNGTSYGGLVRSADGGKTWTGPAPIGQESGLNLPAETDTINLTDGHVLAILRGDENTNVHMHAALSVDNGETFGPVQDLGFLGHCPHLTRLNSGRILLTYRGMKATSGDKGFFVGLRWSDDDGQNWSEASVLGDFIGAYASTVELPDGSVLAVYYEEGVDSAIRSVRFRVGETLEFISPED